MEQFVVSKESIEQYEQYLQGEERSKATIQKYIRDIMKFYDYLPESKVVGREMVLEYKAKLVETYKTTSANSMLVALNGFFDFFDGRKYQVKLCRLQKRVFADQSKELSKKEYMRILKVARAQNDERLFMLIQSICTTGIRVSEHKSITVEALKRGKTEVNNKGKVREIYFDKKLCILLLGYCKRKHIIEGSVFITKSGKPLDRSNIWKKMKKLCKDANVEPEKVFPHNLRHLFAFTYYRLEKDLVRLASILGHSSIETTRIYTMSKGADCRRSLSRLGLMTLPLE